jgi:hypothetical protein
MERKKQEEEEMREEERIRREQLELAKSFAAEAEAQKVLTA